MNPEKCPYHDELAKNVNTLCQSMALLQKDVEYLRRDQEVILARFGNHVLEADKDGGWHTRIIEVENSVKQMAIDRRNDLIMSRWFMFGSAVLASGMVTGAIRTWGIISRIIGA